MPYVIPLLLFLAAFLHPTHSIQQTCSPQLPCPQNAHCKDNYWCACNSNFIGDCSTQAQPLSQTPTQSSLQAGTISLFSIEPINTNHFLEFTIVICQQGTHLPITLYFWGNTGVETDFTSQTTIQQPKQYSFPNECRQFSTSYIQFSQQPNGQKDELVMGMMTESDSQVSVSVSERIVIEIYIFYYIMMAVISFISAFLLVCTIVLIFRRRLASRWRNNRNGRNGNNNIDHFDTMIPAVKAEMTQEVTCPICLQNIETEQSIRVTFCEHTFHQACLDAWCKKNISCPICRNDLSQESMKREAEIRQSQNQATSNRGEQKTNKPTNKDKYQKNWQEEEATAQIEMQMVESPDRVNKQLRYPMIEQQ